MLKCCAHTSCDLCWEGHPLMSLQENLQPLHTSPDETSSYFGESSGRPYRPLGVSQPGERLQRVCYHPKPYQDHSTATMITPTSMRTDQRCQRAVGKGTAAP